MKLASIKLIFLLFLVSSLYSCDEEEKSPCFAGTLLAFFPINAPPGKLSAQPFIFINHTYGTYDANSSLLNNKNVREYDGLIVLETGITDKIDITLELNGLYRPSSQTIELGDTKVFLGFQTSLDKKGSWSPDSRFILGQSFPTGKFENLGAARRGSFPSGSGSFSNSFIFVARKIFYTRNNNPYNWNLNLYYINFPKVVVDGLSIYTTSPNAKGVAKPGIEFIANLAFEYKFNFNWGFGYDIHFNYKDSTSYTSKNGDTSPAGLPSSYNLSLAPEIEYCFTETLSVAVGGWFSLKGRNSLAYRNIVGNVYYMF